MRRDLHFATGANDTETPPEFVAWVESLLGLTFVCDVAATYANRKVDAYFGPDHSDPARRDALVVPWPAGPNWLNPPYGRAERACHPTRCTKKRCALRGYHIDRDVPGCYDFVRKAAEERRVGAETAMLVASRTDTAWFHEFVWSEERGFWYPGVVGKFLPDRVPFIRGGQQDNGAPFPSLLVHFQP